MLKRLFSIATAVTALVVPAAAGASLTHSDSGATTARNSIAVANQTGGRLDPNSCATTQLFSVLRPSSIQVLLAGSNAGGRLYAQVIDPNGTAGPDTGAYEATAPGTYGVRVCFTSDDGIDSQISYVFSTLVTPR
jgi:hypothetical protein